MFRLLILLFLSLVVTTLMADGKETSVAIEPVSVAGGIGVQVEGVYLVTPGLFTLGQADIRISDNLTARLAVVEWLVLSYPQGRIEHPSQVSQRLLPVTVLWAWGGTDSRLGFMATWLPLVSDGGMPAFRIGLWGWGDQFSSKEFQWFATEIGLAYDSQTGPVFLAKWDFPVLKF